MPRLVLVTAVAFVALQLAAGDSGAADRQVPVIIRGEVQPPTIKAGKPIPFAITITNGLPASIWHNTYRLEPNEWNGETVNVSLVDIDREGPPNLYLGRPHADPPPLISGMGSHEIKPGAAMTIKTDARKWTIQGGWLPGNYKVTVRVDSLTLDRYARLSVLSDPVEFKIE